MVECLSHDEDRDLGRLFLLDHHRYPWPIRRRFCNRYLRLGPRNRTIHCLRCHGRLFWLSPLDDVLGPRLARISAQKLRRSRVPHLRAHPTTLCQLPASATPLTHPRPGHHPERAGNLPSLEVQALLCCLLYFVCHSRLRHRPGAHATQLWLAREHGHRA